MASNYSVQVDDLVLFFLDSGKLTNRCIPSKVYKASVLRVTNHLNEYAPGWQGSVVSIQGDPANAYYVANLSHLLEPGEPLADGNEGVPVPTKAPGKPGPKDLIVIPNDDPKNGYLVSQAEYLSCPTLPPETVADIRFMAEQEGALLANIPKLELTGVTCFLLSLSNLRGTSAHPQKTKNREHTEEPRHPSAKK